MTAGCLRVFLFYIGLNARLLDGIIFISYRLPILEWQCLRFQNHNVFYMYHLLLDLQNLLLPQNKFMGCTISPK